MSRGAPAGRSRAHTKPSRIVVHPRGPCQAVDRRKSAVVHENPSSAKKRTAESNKEPQNVEGRGRYWRKGSHNHNIAFTCQADMAAGRFPSLLPSLFDIRYSAVLFPRWAKTA